MEKSKPQFCSIPSPPGNPSIPSPPPPVNPSIPSPPTPHFDHRHSLIAGRLSDALFSAVSAKYATNGTDHSSLSSEQLKAVIERRLHEHFPSFHTPTHIPYASMIQRAIAELGEEDGLSEESISEFIVNEYDDLPWAHAAFMRRNFGMLCESGKLVKSKCGKYKFKVEGKGAKRKKRMRKSVRRTRQREVERADEIEDDLDRKKQSKNLEIIGPRSEEVVTSKGTEELNGSFREVIVGVEDGDHAQGGRVVLDEREEVEKDEMIDKHHGEEFKYKNVPKICNKQKHSGNLVVLGLPAQVTMAGIRKQSGSLGEKKVHGAEGKDHAKGGQIQVLGELKNFRIDMMIDQHCEKEVKSRDQSQDVAPVKLGAREALTSTRMEEKSCLSRKEIDGAKGGGPDQDGKVIMIYELKEVIKVGINDHQEVEVRSKDGVEDVGGRKQLQHLLVVGLRAKEALTTKGTEDQFNVLREKIDGDKEDRAQAGQTEVLDNFQEVQEVEMVDVHHEEEMSGEVMQEPTERTSKGSNEEEGPSEEATLEFFDAMSNHGNAEENGVIDAQGCKKLQEENVNLEFFDAMSDHDDIGANAMIGAQSSKGNVLDEVSNNPNRLQEQLLSKVSDDQTGIRKDHEAEDPQLSKELSQVRWPSEITGTPSISIPAALHLGHQTETLKRADQGMLHTSEADKNENNKALLPPDNVCSPNSQVQGRRGRGRPRKLKMQENLVGLFSSSTQDCDQQQRESNVEGIETSCPDTGNDTHLDQQRLELPGGRGRGKGRGRGRGRPRVVRHDQISMSETVSPSKDLNHQQYPEKRGRGRPRKRKFDENTVSNDILTSNEQQEQESCGPGCGRPGIHVDQ